MKKVLLTNYYTGKPYSIIREILPEGFELCLLEDQSEASLLENAADADYILAGGRRRITRQVLERAGKLKMIQRSGVGLDALDLDAIKEMNIPLYVNQGVNSQSAAEHTLMLMLACLRKLTVINDNTKKGVWKKQEQGVQTFELRGKTVGVIGMGNIAIALVGLLKPFGVRILYHNLVRSPVSFETENNMTFADLDTLLADSDIVTVHCALTEQTRYMINADAIGKMKDGAMLINTARGEIVDVNALADALRSGKLSYAGIDAHVQEPIPEDYPLKTIDNVMITPHIAGVTGDSFRAMMHDAFRNIECFEQGRLEEIAPYRYL